MLTASLRVGYSVVWGSQQHAFSMLSPLGCGGLGSPQQALIRNERPYGKPTVSKFDVLLRRRYKDTIALR